MKSILSVCIATSLALAALHAQSTPPAVPAATPPRVAADPFVKNPGASASDATAGDPAPEADGLWKNVVLVMEVYALPKTDALAILESERGSAARYQRVLDLAAAKKARLETLTAITTKSGQRARTDSVDEVRYPTEFEPAPAKGLAPAATSFEVRNVGDSLEIEPVVDAAAQVCDVSIAPSIVRLVGFRDVPDLEGKPNIPKPVFHSQKLNTSTSVPSGSPHYLGSLTRPSEQGIADGPDAEMSLVFLRIHLHGPQAGEVKKPAKPLNWSALNLEYSVYSMDRAQARELLLAMPTIETPWEKLKSLVTAKQARFEHLVAVQAKSGQKSMVEEIHEIIYPTEFTPPGRARVTESTKRNTTAPGQGNTEETTTVSRELSDGDIVGGAANSFETRNVGVSVEVEPVVGPDQVSIELTHAISSIAYLGVMNPGPIATSFPPQPLFESRNITSNQTILASRHMFVGTFNPPAASGVNDRKDEGRTWLLFVRGLPNEP